MYDGAVAIESLLRDVAEKLNHQTGFAGTPESRICPHVTWHSLSTAIRRLGGHTCLNEILRLTPFFEAGAALPSLDELRDELVQPAHRRLSEIAFSSINLSFGRPSARKDGLSIGVNVRHFRADGHPLLKVKIALFVDDMSAPYWDVGAVDAEASIFRSLGIKQRTVRNWFSLLVECVHRTARMAEKRTWLSGLDLTPAYYHVRHLALRCGATPLDHKRYEDWNRAFSNKLVDALQPLTQKEIDPREISRRLCKGQLKLQSTGEALSWAPQRLVRKTMKPPEDAHEPFDRTYPELRTA